MVVHNGIKTISTKGISIVKINNCLSVSEFMYNARRQEGKWILHTGQDAKDFILDVWDRFLHEDQAEILELLHDE